MRFLGHATTLLVVCFFVLMNGLLVKREIDHRRLDAYRRGVSDFLGERPRRERWMGIFRKGQRIGRTGFSIERRGDLDSAGYHCEFSTRVEFDLFGQGSRLSIEGTAELDGEVTPERFAALLSVGETQFTLDGRRDAGELLVVLREGEKTILRNHLPLRELQLGDGLAPVPPVGGLRVGEVLRVPVFDPIFRETMEAETEVLRLVARQVDGVTLDCLELETRFRGVAFRSFVTLDGEVVRQEVPPPLDVILIREPPPARERR
jgi:hypothetical protein